MSGNETTAFGLTPNAAHGKPPTTPQSIDEGHPRGKFNSPRPVASEVLLEIMRGRTSRLIVTLDTWLGYQHSIKIAAWWPDPKGGEERVKRSITVYPIELKRIALALARAHKRLGVVEP